MANISPSVDKPRAVRPGSSQSWMATLADVLKLIWSHRHILLVTTRAELEKKYAGSYFGLLWTVLYPACFLAMYSFLYMVVFQMRLPEFSQFGYVLFVFSGLIPYLAFAEVAATGAVVVKQNIHLVKNVMMPIDIIPVRIVLMAMAGEVVALVLLIILLLVDGDLSYNLPLIVLALLIQVLFLVGLAWILAALGVLLPDLGNFINLVTLFLLFVSPIAYRPEMVPPRLQWVVDFNPLAYLMDITRSALVAGHPFSLANWLISAAIAVVTFVAGLVFFRRFKTFIVDYE